LGSSSNGFIKQVIIRRKHRTITASLLAGRLFLATIRFVKVFVESTLKHQSNTGGVGIGNGGPLGQLDRIAVGDLNLRYLPELRIFHDFQNLIVKE
jgi:hypothetical protein